MKKYLWIIIPACIIAIAAIILPIYYYVHDFGHLPRSENPGDWGPFGDFFGGILNPIISFLTLAVTLFIAVYLSVIERRNHEETVHSPVKPFLTIHPQEFFSSDISQLGLTVEEDYYTYDPPKQPARRGEHFDKPFYLKVTNRGLAVANAVRVTFEINLEELREVLLINHADLQITSSEILHDPARGNFINLRVISNRFNFQGFLHRIWATETYGLGVIEKGQEINAPIPGQMLDAFQFSNLIRRLINRDEPFPAMEVRFDFSNLYDKKLNERFRVGLFHIHDYNHFSRFRLRQEQIKQ